jgi:hypothetical protein
MVTVGDVVRVRADVPSRFMPGSVGQVLEVRHAEAGLAEALGVEVGSLLVTLQLEDGSKRELPESMLDIAGTARG